MLLLSRHIFVFHPAKYRSAPGVVHAARVGEQMFSFSSSHRELSFNTGGFTSEHGVVGEMDTRWHSKSFLSTTPAYIINDDVILFRPLYHIAQTGSVLLSMQIHFDFQ